MDDRMQSSPAYEALRPSTRRLLIFLEAEIQRQGGGSATIFADQLEMIGGRRVIVGGVSELHALGLIEAVRRVKRYDIRASQRWRDVKTQRDAVVIAGRARMRPMPPQPPSSAQLEKRA